MARLALAGNLRVPPQTVAQNRRPAGHRIGESDPAHVRVGIHLQRDTQYITAGVAARRKALVGLLHRRDGFADAKARVQRLFELHGGDGLQGQPGLTATLVTQLQCLGPCRFIPWQEHAVIAQIARYSRRAKGTRLVGNAGSIPGFDALHPTPIQGRMGRPHGGFGGAAHRSRLKPRGEFFQRQSAP